jgi:O-antigen ligase
MLWLAAWLLREAETPPVARAAWPVLALLVAWVLFLLLQWVPLPAAWVRALSPEAAQVHALADYLEPGRRITLSIDPHASFVFWLKSCAYAAAFALTLALVRSRRRVVQLGYAIVLAGLVQAIYGSLMHLSGVNIELFGAYIPHADSARGGFVNRNHLAGWLEMSLAVGIGLMIAQLEDRSGRSWKQLVRDLAKLALSGKAVLRVLLVVMVVALVMTRSRMGNTAFFASLLVAGAIALVLSRHATRSTVILIASLVVIDIFVIGAWFGVERTLKRIEETTVQQVEERVDPSVYAIGILRDYPVFGSGGGTFYTAFPRYRGHDIVAYYDHAHNDYVQLLAETGAVGAGIVALIVFASFVAAVLAQSRRRDPLARGLAFAVVMGVAALAIHSTVDFNLQIPANALLFAVLLALGWVALHLERAERHGPGIG